MTDNPEIHEAGDASPETKVKVMRSVMAMQEQELAEQRQRINELEAALRRVEQHYKADAAKDIAVQMSMETFDDEIADDQLRIAIADGWKIGDAIYKRLRQDDGEETAEAGDDDGTVN